MTLPPDVAEAVAALLADGLTPEALRALHQRARLMREERRVGPLALVLNVGPRRISGCHVEERHVILASSLGRAS